MKFDELKRMYELCPPYEDCQECGDCCGPLIFTKKEAMIMQEYISKNGIKYPKPDELYCPMRIGGECVIYEVRPVACRLFGKLIPGLKCPNIDNIIHFGKPVGEFWRLLDKYHRYAASCLHFHSFHQKDEIDRDRALLLNRMNKRRLQRLYFEAMITKEAGAVNV